MAFAEASDTNALAYRQKEYKLDRKKIYKKN
jgi:hypothetical protein